MDISSVELPDPFYALSNFAKHPFVLDGVQIASMEGFLQSLKFKDVGKQKAVCLLSGDDAQLAGEDAERLNKVMFWQGVPYRRTHAEYGDLLDRAYCVMMDSNPAFASALQATNEEELTLSIGLRTKTRASVTEQEFSHILNRLRDTLKPNLLNQQESVTRRQRWM